MRLDRVTRFDSLVILEFNEYKIMPYRETRRVRISISAGNRHEAGLIEGLFNYLRDTGGRSIWDDVTIEEV